MGETTLEIAGLALISLGGGIAYVALDQLLGGAKTTFKASPQGGMGLRSGPPTSRVDLLFLMGGVALFALGIGVLTWA